LVLNWNKKKAIRIEKAKIEELKATLGLLILPMIVLKLSTLP